ncbi:hypothetical protein JJQ72_09480 [Paenibacillus sp. F411]|uniref:Uncharacterized protein n=1 Tax=Paenibacillus algicola TaxID=2565926 RepID=A0A4P8XKX5_9BACL|nr:MULTISPECIES: hypothetical protein [Paenibacillus]MBO2944197.1 hypothetical protein [Paenibacillus sp. F411]QCT03088.1 hypothetical protein E6C60_2376 [Paenibacillus algicola]
MSQTHYPWYIVGILVISALLLFMFDRHLLSTKSQGDKAAVRSLGWIHLIIAGAGLIVLLIYAASIG